MYTYMMLTMDEQFTTSGHVYRFILVRASSILLTTVSRLESFLEPM